MVVKKKPAKRMWVVGEQWRDGEEWEWFSFSKKADALRFMTAPTSDDLKVSGPFCYERVEEEK